MRSEVIRFIFNLTYIALSTAGLILVADVLAERDVRATRAVIAFQEQQAAVNLQRLFRAAQEDE